MRWREWVKNDCLLLRGGKHRFEDNEKNRKIQRVTNDCDHERKERLQYTQDETMNTQKARKKGQRAKHKQQREAPENQPPEVRNTINKKQ